MTESPKLSPFGRADDSDLVAALGKPGCDNAACGDSTDPRGNGRAFAASDDNDSKTRS